MNVRFIWTLSWALSLFILTLSVVSTSVVEAQQYLCVERSRGTRNPVCRGRAIPRDRDRNVSSHRLECSSASSRFVREPQKLSRADLDAWRNLKRNPKLENRKEMQKIWQKLPLIQWSGHLNYETVEKWTWQECVIGADP